MIANQKLHVVLKHASLLLLACTLSLGFAAAAVAAKPVKCDPWPSCNNDGDNEGEFELTITYQFGDPTILDDPVFSTVTAIGTKSCGVKGDCLFKGDIQGSEPFFLPETLMGLLALTEWDNTLLNPDECFGDPPQADTTGRGVELAHNADGTWFAAIGSYAKDTAGIVDRKYVFYFLCDGFCDGSDWGDSSMAGVYLGGELLRIEADAKDRGGKTIPCRCTISSEPNCPGEIDIPMSISVTEVPLQ